jgi:hypothetical protein
MRRYNEAGLVEMASSAWLSAQQRAHPDDQRLAGLVFARGNDLVVTYEEFLEALTASIHHFYSAKEAQDGDL